MTTKHNAPTAPAISGAEKGGAAFTPGPWEYRQVADGDYSIDSPPLIGILSLATATTEEDARLIAAAPAMFEALEDAESVLRETREWPATLDTVRAALSKAKGV